LRDSYLGFGLMAARAATLDWEATAAANPCVPLDHIGSFEYGNKQHELHATKQGCVHSALPADHGIPAANTG
jgi:hypothetical protein